MRALARDAIRRARPHDDRQLAFVVGAAAAVDDVERLVGVDDAGARRLGEHDRRVAVGDDAVGGGGVEGAGGRRRGGAGAVADVRRWRRRRGRRSVGAGRAHALGVRLVVGRGRHQVPRVLDRRLHRHRGDVEGEGQVGRRLRGEEVGDLVQPRRHRGVLLDERLHLGGDGDGGQLGPLAHVAVGAGDVEHARARAPSRRGWSRRPRRSSA